MHNSTETLSNCRTNLGCWKDTEQHRAIGEKSGDQYRSYSVNPIENCHNFAKEKGWSVFGVQAGDECFTAVNAEDTYQKHGQSRDCSDGKGGGWALDVYRITNCQDPGT